MKELREQISSSSNDATDLEAQQQHLLRQQATLKDRIRKLESQVGVGCSVGVPRDGWRRVGPRLGPSSWLVAWLGRFQGGNAVAAPAHTRGNALRQDLQAGEPGGCAARWLEVVWVQLVAVGWRWLHQSPMHPAAAHLTPYVLYSCLL